MRIYSTSLALMEDCKLPNLFTILGYKVYFWSNENNEPIHVHISKGSPSPGAAKVWLTSNGGCILASNPERIPQRELNALLEIIQAQFFMICSAWKKHFKDEHIKFYC